jgi:plasmid stabilization system protein ParE
MADKAVIFHLSALEEADEAVKWYMERNEMAANAFSRELNQAVEKVSKSPETWLLYENDIRKYVFPRFPFILYYRIVKEGIEILAVAHTKRKPGYWKGR